MRGGGVSDEGKDMATEEEEDGGRRELRERG